MDMIQYTTKRIYNLEFDNSNQRIECMIFELNISRKLVSYITVKPHVNKD